MLTLLSTIWTGMLHVNWLFCSTCLQFLNKHLRPLSNQGCHGITTSLDVSMGKSVSRDSRFQQHSFSSRSM